MPLDAGNRELVTNGTALRQLYLYMDGSAGALGNL